MWDKCVFDACIQLYFCAVIYVVNTVVPLQDFVIPKIIIKFLCTDLRSITSLAVTQKLRHWCHLKIFKVNFIQQLTTAQWRWSSVNEVGHSKSSTAYHSCTECDEKVGKTVKFSILGKGSVWRTIIFWGNLWSPQCTVGLPREPVFQSHFILLGVLTQIWMWWMDRMVHILTNLCYNLRCWELVQVQVLWQNSNAIFSV